MDKSLLHSLERLKSFKIRLPDVCLHPGRPVELEKWIKKTVSSSCSRPALDSVTMEELYAKVKNQEKNRKVVLDLRREIPFLPVLLTRDRKEKPRFYEVLLQDILQAKSGICLFYCIRTAIQGRTAAEMHFSFPSERPRTVEIGAVSPEPEATAETQWP